MREKVYEIRPYDGAYFRVYWKYREDDVFLDLFNPWRKVKYFDSEDRYDQFKDYFHSEKWAEKWIDNQIRYDQFKAREEKIDFKALHAAKYPPRRYP